MKVTILRKNVKRPSTFNSENLLDFTAKNVKKFHGVSAEKWFLGKKITEDDFKKGQTKFLEIDCISDDDREALSKWLEDCKEYIQIMFRTEEPSSHILKLKPFWSPKQKGLAILDIWFEWLVDGSGSKENCVIAVIEKRMDNVMKIVEQVLIAEKADGFQNILSEEEKKSLDYFGNRNMYYVDLLRRLCVHWKNSPEKFIYIEGQDIGEVSAQPFIYVVIANQHGAHDYDRSLVISVRVGHTVFFEDVTLCQALAAMLEITFAFNLLYDIAVDDICNFLQRILANLDYDGARNKKGATRKKFNDFKISLGEIVLKKSTGSLKKILS